MKALALDLDGTVLNHAGEFPPQLVTTLQQLHDKGIKIIIATGRSKQMIHQKVPAEVPIDGYVAASGMTVYSKDALLSSTSFSKEQIHFVLDQVRQHKIYYEITTANQGGPYTYKKDMEYSMEDLTATADPTVLDYEQIGTERTLKSDFQWIDEDDISLDDIIKFYFFSNNKEKMDNWHQYLIKHFTTSKGFQVYQTSNHNSEIMVYGTDKATGLEILTKEMNISLEDIHAFGDSMNDISMFEVAGKSTALKNGHDSIKALADDITEFTCDENGLHHYLQKHYL